ncbi:uncharacterized protein DMENIID0001_082550 [Sergentomyia squamirostris]
MDKFVLFVTILVTIVAITPTLGVDDGKYKATDDGKYRPDDGKYKPNAYAKKGQYVHQDDGKYGDNPAKWRYVHVDDQREKGKYIHIHIPYDGGYGPYSHLDNPYKHIDNPYIHDIEPQGEYR